MTPLTKLLQPLERILEEAEDREDVEDRDDGTLRPNIWMNIAHDCRDAIEGVKRFHLEVVNEIENLKRVLNELNKESHEPTARRPFPDRL